MSFTISEATDVNVLLQYVMNKELPANGGPTPFQAKAAAAHLAAKAHKKLKDGITEQDVMTGWKVR